jgi:hypothetical protein
MSCCHYEERLLSIVIAKPQQPNVRAEAISGLRKLEIASCLAAGKVLYLRSFLQ